MKVSFLVDGFNLYHSILKLEKDTGSKTRWLNLPDFLKSTLVHFDKSAVCGDIYFFTAYRNHLKDKHPETIERHIIYNRILRSLGVLVEVGKFKERTVNCRECKKDFIKHEEKETDVAIATKLIDISINKNCDAIGLVTGDTDLIPAIKFAKSHSPEIKIVSLFPYCRKNEDLKKYVDDSIKLKQQRYADNQLKNPFILNEKELHKPSHW